MPAARSQSASAALPGPGALTYDAAVDAVRTGWKHVKDPAGRKILSQRRPEMAAVQKATKRVEEMEWPSGEINGNERDRTTYETLKRIDPPAAETVKRSIVWFLDADEVVLKQIEGMDLDELPLEMQHLMMKKEAQEVTHTITYNNVAESTLTSEELAEAAELAADLPAAGALLEWAKRRTGHHVLVDLIVTSLTELGAFAGVFVIPHELKKQNMLPTLQNANRVISRDEYFHVEIMVTCVRAAMMAVELGAPEFAGTFRAALQVIIETLMEEMLEATAPLLDWIFGESGKVGMVTRATAQTWTESQANAVVALFMDRCGNLVEEAGAPCWRAPRPCKNCAGLQGSPGKVAVAQPRPEAPDIPEWMLTIAIGSDQTRPNFFESDSFQYLKQGAEGGTTKWDLGDPDDL